MTQCAPFGLTNGRSKMVMDVPVVNFVPGSPGTSDVELVAMFVKSVVTVPGPPATATGARTPSATRDVDLRSFMGKEGLQPRLREVRATGRAWERSACGAAEGKGARGRADSQNYRRLRSVDRRA